MSKLRWRFRQIVWLSQKNLNFKRNTTIAKNIILSSTICSFLLQWKLQSLFQTGLKDIPCHRLATKESQKCKSCVYLMVTILFKATQGHRFSPTIEMFRLSHFSFFTFGHFWWRGYQNKKILHNLCLYFARQEGQDRKNRKKISQLKWPKYLKPKDENTGWTKQ